MRHTYYLLLITAALSLSGCVTTQFLQEDASWLKKQRIKGTRKVEKHVLAHHYQQQPNTQWMGARFLLWLYQTGQRSFDPAAIQRRMERIEADFDAKTAIAAGDKERIGYLQKRRERKLKTQARKLEEGNLLMRLGEAPVLYSPQQREATTQSLLTYLQTKGYFKAQVRSEIKLQDKKASVTYFIEENAPYYLGECRFNTADKPIQQLFEEHQAESLLNRGAQYDQEVLRQERERIYALVSNNGYFGFNKQYIRFDVDITGVDNAVVIATVIDMPANSQPHRKFHIDQVEWIVHADQPAEVEHGVQNNGITFRNLEQQFIPRVLANKLPLRPGQLYSKEKLIEIQRRLSSLDIFDRINITHDILGEGKLRARVYTLPADRYQLSSELGLQMTHWLPGPFCNFSLKSRNIFRRLGTLTLATNVGLEGASSAAGSGGFSTSQALGANLSFAWPQFLFPLKDTTRMYLEKLHPVTKLSLGYDFSRRPDYTQNTFTSCINYGWKDRSIGTYELVPLRIDVIDTLRMDDSFREHLAALREQGNSLHRSFNPSWISLLSFQSTFTQRPTSDTDLSYSSLALFFESGGVLKSLFNMREIMPKLQFYQYLKFNIGYKQHLPLRPSTLFAYQVNTGIAFPYGEERALPFTKHYFVGGPNDLRAWSPRSLGPGSHSPAHNKDKKYYPEQPGELLLQGNVELRQQLVGFLEGALFLDGGNIWTLRADGRQDGQFSIKKFYQEIALGTGVGLRLNFKLLVLRLDVGFKLYNPAKPLGERWVDYRLAFGKEGGLKEQTVFNIGIGYPF